MNLSSVVYSLCYACQLACLFNKLYTLRPLLDRQEKQLVQHNRTKTSNKNFSSSSISIAHMHQFT